MAKRGRISKADKDKPIDPIKQEQADQWMKTIGENYKEVKEGFKANQLKQGNEWNEDVFQESIILCYQSIQRNGLKDMTTQGCKNYFLRAFKMNIMHESVIAWNARKVEDDNAISNYINGIDDNGEFEKKKQQLLNDYSVIKIMNIVENNFDQITFYCFRLKFLLPKMSYAKLVKLTKIKNAKARVKTVIDYLKENITEEDIYKDFIEEYPDME